MNDALAVREEQSGDRGSHRKGEDYAQETAVENVPGDVIGIRRSAKLL